MGNIDTEYTSQMVCPHCGYEDYDSWELSNDSGGTDCASCGKQFNYERQIEVTYTTTK